MVSLPLLLAVQSGSGTLPDGPDLTRYFLACGGLLVLILVLAYGFRRGFARTLAARAARRSLRVVDVLPLGGSKRLVVVHCYDRVFLVGQGEKELCSIAELDLDQVQGPPVSEETTGDAASIEQAGLPETVQGLVGRPAPTEREAVDFAHALLRASAPPAPPTTAPPRSKQATKPAPSKNKRKALRRSGSKEQPTTPRASAVAPQGVVAEERPTRPVLENGKGILG